MKLYLIRHGETESNAKGIVSDKETPLSEKGINQAKEVAEKYFSSINLDCIYSSPLKRTKQTAELIAKKHPHAKVVETHYITEKRDPSSFTNKKRNELPWDLIFSNRSNADWKYEDGESFNDVKERILSIFTELEKYPEDANVLLVTHHSFIKHLVSYIILGNHFNPIMFYTFSDRFETKNAGVTVLERKQKYYENQPSWYLAGWMI